MDDDDRTLRVVHDETERVPRQHPSDPLWGTNPPDPDASHAHSLWGPRPVELEPEGRLLERAPDEVIEFPDELVLHHRLERPFFTAFYMALGAGLGVLIVSLLWAMLVLNG